MLIRGNEYMEGYYFGMFIICKELFLWLGMFLS